MSNADYPYEARDAECRYIKEKAFYKIDGFAGPPTTCASITAAL